MSTKNDYLSDPELTTMPWLSSPFAHSLINMSGLNDKQKHYCRKFANDGYIVVDLDLSGDELSVIINDMGAFADVEYKQHFYDKDADHPRYFDLWRKSEAVCNLARHPDVLSILKMLYGRNALPFQTINFKAASEQLAHSDFIHFGCIPKRWVAGVAVYLEDTNQDNGPFMLYPGTQIKPCYELNDIGIFNSMYPNVDPGEVYRRYEEFIQAIIEQECLKPKTIHGPAGSAIIFDANILHGGAPVIDKNTTRLSQVTHYYFEGTYGHYCPLFSDSHTGVFATKDMSTKDILGQKFNEEV